MFGWGLEERLEVNLGQGGLCVGRNGGLWKLLVAVHANGLVGSIRRLNLAGFNFWDLSAEPSFFVKFHGLTCRFQEFFTDEDFFFLFDVSGVVVVHIKFVITALANVLVVSSGAEVLDDVDVPDGKHILTES